MPHHCHCGHARLRHCGTCRIVYCQDCHQEWGQRTWPPAYWTWTPYYSAGSATYTTLASQGQLSNQTYTITSSHTHDE